MPLPRVVIIPPKDASDLARYAGDVQRELERVVAFVNELLLKNPSLEIGEVPNASE